MIGGIVLTALTAAVLGGYKIHRIHERDQCGILLAFDDYSGDNWEEYFDILDEYDAKVTFFINADEPTDFCCRARERGHEIAYHGMKHRDLTEMSEEEIYEYMIAPIEIFKEKGVKLTTFAYPYGKYNEKLNEKLLKYYNILRGAHHLEIYGKHQLRKGFVESMSLDNVNFNSQEEYEEHITQVLNELKNGKARVLSMYSHAVGAGDWCISEEKLLFLLQKAREMGLKFYTFQELQYW